MKIAVMQPYFFPYIGYYQLVDAVDLFVFLDDVNFIKRGWINRNTLVFNKKNTLFSIPLRNPSQNAAINRVRLATDAGQEFQSWLRKFRQSLELNYKNQQFYEEGRQLLEEALATDREYISDLAAASVINASRLLGIKTRFDFASRIDPNPALKSEERIIKICQLAGSSHYINPPGGRDLYTTDQFESRGISLQFLQPALKPYAAAKRESPTGLSILDAIMCRGSRFVASELLPGYGTEEG